MFICEFRKIFKNIFRQKHLWMTPSCVYLWILRSFSDHLAFLEHLWETAYFIYKLPNFNHHIQLKNL